MKATLRLLPPLAALSLVAIGVVQFRRSHAGVGPAAPPLPAAGPAPKGDRPTSGCQGKGTGRTFVVGPGKPLARLGDVPFETLKAGDTVQVFWRPEPYREKLMISGQGTEKAPIRICGVPGPSGQLPVIDGKDAVTRPELDFPYAGHQVRGVVIIGHAHDRPYAETPAHILFEGFEVRNGAPPNGFTDRAGKRSTYSAIAAGIFVERAERLTVRGCKITENNTGIFTASGGDLQTLSHDLLFEGNYVVGNGSLADYYEHNVYNEGSNVVYQFNRFGSPRGGPGGVLGANIKERSAGVVIRYNWIEDGAHILDIVDAQEAQAVTSAMPSFHATYVYGNLIIRGPEPSGSLIHYGGDSGVFQNYRKGTLFFYNNTVVVKNDRYPNWSRTPIFELSTNEEHLDSRNNVYFSTVEPRAKAPVGLLGERDRVTAGVATFAGDWMRAGWTAHDLTPGLSTEIKASLTGFEGIRRGETPALREDYSLGPGAPAATAPLRPVIPEALLPTAEYARHQQGRTRSSPPIVGAFGKP